LATALIAVSEGGERIDWYFIQFITLCPITIFDKNAQILTAPFAVFGTSRPMLTGEIRSQIDAV
jgi:hypothetical protein